MSSGVQSPKRKSCSAVWWYGSRNRCIFFARRQNGEQAVAQLILWVLRRHLTSLKSQLLARWNDVLRYFLSKAAPEPQMILKLSINAHFEETGLNVKSPDIKLILRSFL